MKKILFLKKCFLPLALLFAFVLPVFAVPAITLTTVPLAAGDMVQNSNNNLVYIVQVDVAANPAVINAIQFTLTGTYDNNDINNIRIWSNSTPSLTGATQIVNTSGLFAAPRNYNIGLGNQNIAMGVTRYFIITADVDNAATNNNTIKLDGAANPVTFSYATAPAITNNQTDVAGLKTIRGPAVTLSSLALPGGSVTHGSINNPVYITQLDNQLYAQIITGAAFTVGGTFDNNDIALYGLHINSIPSLTGATLLATQTSGAAAPEVVNFTFNNAISSSTSRYFILTVNIEAEATTNTIKVNGAVNPATFTFNLDPVVTNNQTDISGSFNISSVLPVTLISFKGTDKNKYVQLNWRTASEINSKFFEVEHSLNGRNFSTYATIVSTGNYTNTSNYSYKHFKAVDGINYYRLKMTDRDNSFKYSEVIGVMMKKQNQDLTIYPNPAKALINISFTAANNAIYEIVMSNMEGKIVSNQTIIALKGHNIINYNAGLLIAGKYNVMLVEKNTGQIIKSSFLKL